MGPDKRGHEDQVKWSYLFAICHNTAAANMSSSETGSLAAWKLLKSDPRVPLGDEAADKLLL